MERGAIVSQNSLLIAEKDQLLFISERVSYHRLDCSRFGAGHSRLEIYTDAQTGEIVAVECDCNLDKHEMTVDMPDISELSVHDGAYYYPPDDCTEETYLPFDMVYDRNQIVVLFSGSNGESSCFQSGRVVYFYDDDDNLLSIQIRNLTEEEYLRFKAFYA